MQLIAVNLIGIPASGKTTLGLKLVELSKKNLLGSGVIVLSFDEFIKIDFISIKETGVYKKCREKLLENIEGLIKRLHESDQGRWNEILSSNQELKIDQSHYHIELDAPTLIIFDDNMQFRSMRQRVRAMSRTFQCQHFQMFVKSTLEDAKNRNSLRANPVPESVIEKMFHNLEEPANPRTIFIDRILTDAELLSKLHDRIENPEKEQVEEPKSPQQQQSLIHEIDIFTRKEISSRIKDIKGKKDFSKCCETLNRKRKEFLEDLGKQNLDAIDVESLRAAFNCYLDK